MLVMGHNSGNGLLRDGETELGMAEFKLHIRKMGHAIGGDGSLYADTEILMQALTAANVTLQPEGMQRLDIAVISYTPGDAAKFALNTNPLS